jgi:peptidoglycan hydrolase CwlO-like protein
LFNDSLSNICFSPFLKDLRGVISSLEAFASQFTSLEADKVRLQKEVKSSSSKLDGAVKIAAAARQEVDSLKEELGKLKEKLKEEEASRLVAEARATEKDELLRQSSLALLGNFFYASLSIIALMNLILCQ